MEYRNTPNCLLGSVLSDGLKKIFENMMRQVPENHLRFFNGSHTYWRGGNKYQSKESRRDLSYKVRDLWLLRKIRCMWRKEEYVALLLVILTTVCVINGLVFTTGAIIGLCLFAGGVALGCLGAGVTVGYAVGKIIRRHQ